MATPHVGSGEVVSLPGLCSDVMHATTQALMKSRQLEIVRIVLHAGKNLPEHQVEGELTLQCLKGLCILATPERTVSLKEGDWVHLQAHEPHALTAVADTVMLLTLRLPD